MQRTSQAVTVQHMVSNVRTVAETTTSNQFVKAPRLVKTILAVFGHSVTTAAVSTAAKTTTKTSDEANSNKAKPDPTHNTVTGSIKWRTATNNACQAMTTRVRDRDGQKKTKLNTQTSNVGEKVKPGLQRSMSHAALLTMAPGKQFSSKALLCDT